MRLARRNFTAGDTRKVTVDYSQWLADGASLDSATVLEHEASADVTVTAVTVFADHITFLLAVDDAAEQNTEFTLDVQVIDSLDQTKNDTLEYVVQLP